MNAGPRHRFTVSGRLVSNCYLITGAGLLDLMAATFATAGLPLPDYMTEAWCDEFIVKWFGVYKGVKRYLDSEQEKIRRFGMCWTRFGRVRRVPAVRSYHRYVQEAGIREGCNHGIQGYSADIMKLAMGALAEENKQLLAYGIEVYPNLTIYDELIQETREDDAEVVEAIMGDVMDNVLVDRQSGELESKVPILSDGKVMKQWAKD